MQTAIHRLATWCLALTCLSTACGGPGNRYVPDAPRERLDPLELRNELREMAELTRRLHRKLAEQQAKLDVPPARLELTNRIEHVESRQARRIERIFDLLGNRWPDNSLVGRKASRAALVVVQHLDNHRGLQRRALRLLQWAVDKDEAPRSFVAFLKDRLRISRQRDQLYGTQIRIRDGEVVPWPIADRDKLEERRQKMGLPPMDEYIERVRREHGLDDE